MWLVVCVYVCLSRVCVCSFVLGLFLWLVVVIAVSVGHGLVVVGIVALTDSVLVVWLFVRLFARLLFVCSFVVCSFVCAFVVCWLFVVC